MATYATAYYATVTFDGTSYTITNVLAQAATTTDNDGASDNFAVDENIDIIFASAPESPQPAIYAGSFGDGVLVSAGADGISFVLLSNTAYAQGSSITPNRSDSFATCFLAGTRIATPEGERAIETLSIGDRVLTATGEALPIRWIGRQTVVAAFADRARAWPVRIGAGALGQGLPRRDLFVSPDHALLVEGLLVQAGALVGQPGIARVTQPAPRFTYHHLELPKHALVLAEGAAAESFVDNVTRARFDNFPEYVALHGDTPAATDELPLARVKSARQLPASLRNSLSRAA
ncbi:Hint domain-containing protein [Roseomonas sp. 18066]|uniref:Hint domain-containing protein n=1 Tax=Roseomonas sp. 18066 TaxID=2681412 RepID=UPI00135678AB|nr:Hint domain-containing protein [Roseomonas sp. 18066]